MGHVFGSILAGVISVNIMGHVFGAILAGVIIKENNGILFLQIVDKPNSNDNYQRVKLMLTTHAGSKKITHPTSFFGNANVNR